MIPDSPFCEHERAIRTPSFYRCCDCHLDLFRVSDSPKTLVYLAVPYSHPDPEVKLARFRTVNRVAARLMREGLHIFSPISSSHPIAEDGKLPSEWVFWEKYDTAFLNECRLLLVLMLPGWKESVGVTAEIQIAKRLGIPVEYIEE